MITSLPHDLSNISEVGVAFLGASILFVIAMSRLISNFRNLQWERKEGFPSFWYRRPKILKRVAWAAFLSGLLVEVGYAEYALLVQYFLHGSFRWSILFMFLLPCVFYLFSAFFYLYSLFQEVLNRHSY